LEILEFFRKKLEVTVSEKRNRKLEGICYQQVMAMNVPQMASVERMA